MKSWPVTVTPWSFIVCLHWNYSAMKCMGSVKYTIIKGLNWPGQNKMFQIRPKGLKRKSSIGFTLQNHKNHCWSLQSKIDLKFTSNNYHYLHYASVVQFESDKDWFSLKELSCGLTQSQGSTYDLVKIKKRSCNWCHKHNKIRVKRNISIFLWYYLWLCHLWSYENQNAS